MTTMDMVQIKIKKDNNTLSYVKIIREFDKSIPLSEIKKRIENNEFVHSFDLDGRDWMHIQGMTEYKWHRQYYHFLKSLEKAGADMEIYINGRLENMVLLNNWIHTIKGISDDSEKFPD